MLKLNLKSERILEPVMERVKGKTGKIFTIIFLFFIQTLKCLKANAASIGVKDINNSQVTLVTKTCFEINHLDSWCSSYKNFKESFLADFKVSKTEKGTKKVDEKTKLNSSKVNSLKKTNILEKISEIFKINSQKDSGLFCEFLLTNFNIFTKQKRKERCIIRQERSVLPNLIGNSSWNLTDSKETYHQYLAKPVFKKLRLNAESLPFDYSRGFTGGIISRASGYSIKIKNQDSGQKNQLPNKHQDGGAHEFFLNFKDSQSILNLNKFKKKTKKIFLKFNSPSNVLVKKINFPSQRLNFNKKNKLLCFTKKNFLLNSPEKIDMMEKMKQLDSKRLFLGENSKKNEFYGGLFSYSYFSSIMNNFMENSIKKKFPKVSRDPKSLVFSESFIYQDLPKTKKHSSLNGSVNFLFRTYNPKFFSLNSLRNRSKKFRNMKVNFKKSFPQIIAKKYSKIERLIPTKSKILIQNSTIKKMKAEMIKSNKIVKFNSEKNYPSEMAFEKFNERFKDYNGMSFYSTLHAGNLMIPKSNTEENKKLLAGSLLGKKEAMMEIFYKLFEGDNIPKNKFRLANYLNSAAKRGSAWAYYENQLLFGAPLKSNSKSDLPFFPTKNLGSYQISSEKISFLSKRREKSLISRILLSSSVNPDEINNLKLLYHSLIDAETWSIAGKMYTRCNKILAALGQYTRSSLIGSSFSKNTLETILRENRQPFILKKISDLSSAINSKFDSCADFDHLIGLNMPKNYKPLKKQLKYLSKKIFDLSNFFGILDILVLSFKALFWFIFSFANFYI